MIKLFVSDMDGTLLNSDHVISPETATQIKKLQEHGIEFVIATGRTFHSAKPLLQMHQIECDMINLNGAAIYDRSGNLIEAIEMDKDLAQDIIEYCQTHQIDYSLMTAQYFYVKDRQKLIDRISDFLLSETKIGNQDTSSAVQFIQDFSHIKNLSDYEKNQGPAILKMMIMSEENKVLQQFKRVFEKFSKLDITSSNHDNLEITHLNAQKGFAVQQYANAKGITMDEVACIGDSLNDRSMIIMAGQGYVMENASDEVKTLSPLRAPHHDQEGVSQVISKLLESQG